MKKNTAKETTKVSAEATAPKKKASKARTKTAKQPKKTKAGKSAAKKTAATKPAKPKRVSAIDAAAQVLAKGDKPMSAKDLIGAMAEQGLWKSPGGKTPHATLYAAIFREIAKKGDAARFQKVDRGLFAFNG